MIKTLFILNSSGEILIEKHWRGVTGRAVVDVFWEEVGKHASAKDVPPVISTPMYYLINVLRDGMFFLAVVQAEVAPLMVIELLHRIVKVFHIYFGPKLRETTIQENFATVYQVLEEILDNGFPLITEPNALAAMVPPPTIAGKVMTLVTGRASVSDTVDAGAMSVIPWRATGIKYMKNEILFDVVEELDCIVNSNGQVVTSDCFGVVACKCHLSGTPECTLSFADTGMLDDMSFHPCVRLARFERDRVLSFVPPDGTFDLMKYRVKSRRPAAPLYCRPNVTYSDTGGRIEVMCGPKPLFSGGAGAGAGRGRGAGAGSGRPVDALAEDVVIVLTFPKEVKSVDVSASVGVVAFPHDAQGSSVVCHWKIGRLPPEKSPRLTGSLALRTGAKPAGASVTATIRFVLPGASVSGLRIREMRVVNQAYKLKKGMRSMIRSGRFQVRA